MCILYTAVLHCFDSVSSGFASATTGRAKLHCSFVSLEKSTQSNSWNPGLIVGLEHHLCCSHILVAWTRDLMHLSHDPSVRSTIQAKNIFQGEWTDFLIKKLFITKWQANFTKRHAREWICNKANREATRRDLRTALGAEGHRCLSQVALLS